MQLDKDLLDALGVTSERIFGYIYAGIITTITAWLINPTPIEHLLNAAGAIVAVLLVIAVGSGVFGIYFRVLGSLILFPLTHWLHRGLDRLRAKTQLDTVTSTIGYLRRLGVRKPEAAYLAIKDGFTPVRSKGPLGLDATATDVRFFHAHGEGHFLYLTTIVTLFAGVFVNSFRSTPALPWFVASAASYVGAVIGDIRLHSEETAQMRGSEKELRVFLHEHRFLCSEFHPP